MAQRVCWTRLRSQTCLDQRRCRTRGQSAPGWPRCLRIASLQPCLDHIIPWQGAAEGALAAGCVLRMHSAVRWLELDVKSTRSVPGRSGLSSSEMVMSKALLAAASATVSAFV
eukprot:5753074-Pleurochrysis_carterae.AAC.2